MLEFGVLIIGTCGVALLAYRTWIDHRLYLLKLAEQKSDSIPTVLIERKDSKDAKSVDDWILKEWAVEEWTKEMKKYPENSPKRKAYEDRLKSMGRYGDRHKA